MPEMASVGATLEALRARGLLPIEEGGPVVAGIVRYSGAGGLGTAVSHAQGAISPVFSFGPSSRAEEVVPTSTRCAAVSWTRELSDTRAQMHMGERFL